MGYTAVAGTLAHLKRYYGEMHTQMNRMESMYRLQFDHKLLRLPRGVTVHVPSTAPAIVDSSRSQIRTDAPRLTVSATGSDQPARARAQRQRMAGAMFLRRLTEAPGTPIVAQAMFDFALLGAACSKTVYDMDLVPPAPQRSGFSRRSAFLSAFAAWEAVKDAIHPFFDVALDPRTVFIPPGADWPYPWVIEVQSRTVAEVKAGYPKFTDPRAPAGSDDPTRRVAWTEMWHPDHVERYADGELVAEVPNARGVVPYVWSYSGLGSSRHGVPPEEAAVGILHHVESELQAEVRLKTALDALWQYHVWPRLLTQEDPNKLKRNMEMGAGGIIQWNGPSEARPQFLEPPQPNQSMWAFLPEIKDSMTKATLQDVLQGSRPRGVDFGYLQSLLIGQARLRFGTVKQNVEIYAARLVQLKFMQLRAAGHSLSVRGLDEKVEVTRRLSKRDLAGHVEIAIEFGVGDPLEDPNMVNTLIAAVQGGVLDERSAIEKLGRDPDEVLAESIAWRTVRLAADQGMFLPDVLQRVEQNKELEGAQQATRNTQRAVSESITEPGAREGAPRLKRPGLGNPAQTPPLRGM